MAKPGGGGLFASFRNIAATLLATGHTRLALLGNELQIEKHRALRLLGVAVALAFCLGTAVLLIMGLALVLMWEQRVAVLCVGIALFGGLAVFFYRMLMRAGEAPDHPFAGSLAELQEDLRQLKAATGDAKEPR